MSYEKFIFGLIGGLFIVPVINALLEVIYVWIEVLKIQPTKIISKWNKEMQASGTGEEQTFAIGFQAPDENEEFEDEDFYDG